MRFISQTGLSHDSESSFLLVGIKLLVFFLMFVHKREMRGYAVQAIEELSEGEVENGFNTDLAQKLRYRENGTR